MTDFPRLPRNIKASTAADAVALRKLADVFLEQADTLPQASALRAHLRREATLLRTRLAEFEQSSAGGLDDHPSNTAPE